jgi:hypothetical protein
VGPSVTGPAQPGRFTRNVSASRFARGNSRLSWEAIGCTGMKSVRGKEGHGPRSSHALGFPRLVRHGAEVPVTVVAQARHNVLVFVQAGVQRCGHHRDLHSQHAQRTSQRHRTCINVHVALRG